MLIGKYPEDSENARLDSRSLLRHVGILGNSGSGKTVMAKIILEECALAGIPSIILDVQGDLARMALPTKKDPKADSKRQSEWNKTSEVRIWTPASDSGLPICLNPFKIPRNDLEGVDEQEAWDRMAVGIAEILGYDISDKKGDSIRAFLFTLLVDLAHRNSIPSDFGGLAKIIEQVDPDEYSHRIKSSVITELVISANSFHTGPQSRMYTHGTPLSIPLMLEPRIDGRTPVNVLYLNTLPDESRKMSFISQFCRELYDWAIQNAPEQDEPPQVMLFLDEAGSFIPPDPKKTATKPIIKKLLKEGRKFGVGCMLASQSLGDLDYMTVGQTNTTFLGRFTAHQDIKKVRQMLKGMQADESVTTRLATLDPGQFLMVSSGSEGGGVNRVDARWLLTSHGKPLNRDELSVLVSKVSRDWAKGESEKSAPKRAKVSKKLRESAKSQKSRASGEASTGTPLLGGFTHLADGSDPLHVLMGVTHAVTALTLLLCTYTLGNLWAEGEISQLPFIVSAAVSALMGLGLALDFILRNESGLSKKIRSKARRLEGLVLLWVWTLWGMEATGAMDLSEWAFMILISQTLLTAFFALEVYHRVRLGRLELVGETIVDKLKSGVRGIPVILTGAEVEELRATSEQIHDGLRTFMEVATVGLLVALMTAEIDLDTAWVSELAVRIASLDVALLLSKAIASREKRL